ncbi:MAG: hypothetical protein KDI17_10835 [Halioglobus sp.]|nr:hypothetical protein [Halioglobus sp.]
MFPNYPVVALLALLIATLPPTAPVHAQAAAPIMPLAHKALLLDVATAGPRLVVAGEHGIVLYSDDNGDHWEQALVPTARMLTAVHFVDARKGWGVGHDGLVLVSADGGQNWRVQRDGLAMQHQLNLEQRENAHQRVEELELQLASADEADRAAIEADLEEAQFDLEDAELTLEEPVFTSPLLDVWFQDSSLGWAVGAFGTFIATADGGRHWVSRDSELDNPDELHLNAVTGDGRGRVFIVGEGGLMFRSLDSGHSWEPLQPFYDGSWFGAVYDPHYDALLVFGLRGNLYRSTDFGDTWAAVATGNSNTLAGGNWSADGIVVVGGDGTVLHSTDGGQGFRKLSLRDHLALSSGIARGGELILVGQGGVKTGHGGIVHE